MECDDKGEMSVRLAIDCFKLVKGAGKSIGIYNVALSLTQNLVLDKKKSSDRKKKNCEIIVIGNKYNKEDFDIDGVRFIQIDNYNPLNKVHCIIWELFSVSNVCKKLKVDKVLFPRGYCALTHPIEDIVLIHDLIPFYYNEQFPGVFNKYENAYIMSRLRSSAKTAKSIITISEASKADIIKYCNVKEDKITVIHNACNVVDFHESKSEQKEPYICAMTSSLPHKNAKGIINGYVTYFKESSKPLNLVVLGLENVDDYEVDDEIEKHIKCYRFIKDNNDMYRIINNSEMFLFLSLIEGFGLPPIEAMQLDVPVICSKISSLPEVVGDSAILVEPTDDREVAAAITKLQDNPNMKKELINSGRSNINRFAWDTRAKLYWDAILKTGEKDG